MNTNGFHRTAEVIHNMLGGKEHRDSIINGKITKMMEKETLNGMIEGRVKVPEETFTEVAIRIENSTKAAHMKEMEPQRAIFIERHLATLTRHGEFEGVVGESRVSSNMSKLAIDMIATQIRLL